MLRLLGSMEMEVAGRRVELGPAKQRTVLAVLAVDAGRLVPWSALVDRVWDRAPASEPRGVLYAYANRIRRLLRQVDAGAAGPMLELARRSGGYVLLGDSDQVDLHRFRRLVARSRDWECADADRVRLLQEALELWRGAALADLPGEWAARMRQSWSLERLDAAVDWSAAELRLGRHERVVGEARALLAEHPHAEPLVTLLMRALAAAGRPAEALDCYATTRARLVDELGADPGPELRAVHQAILRGELGQPIPTPAPASSGAGAGRVVPAAQLPADVHAFTGRTAELAELDRLGAVAGDSAASGKDTPAAVVISAVSGTAGVGKTALAIRWAHQVRDRFPDGQLYVNLRGYDPEQPVSPGDALAGFLNALGLTGQDIPLELEARAARYRTEVSGRRFLVLLDNAASVEQVRPLLPGTPSCLVLVTSRDSLAGLVALHGALRLDLDVLPPQDAVALLCALIGGRVEDEPEAAAELADQCVRLPLALRVAAELATTRPGSRLAELVAELVDQQRRLDLLDAGGDPRAAIRAVFSWSYQHLPGDAARAFRLLGLYPGADLDAYALAALTDTTRRKAERLLDTLARAHLIQPTRHGSGAAGRYGMHDLLRAYATDLTHIQDSQDGREAALTRLFDYYLGTASAAMDALHPAEQHRRPRVPPPDTPAPTLADPAAARAWLDAERPALVGIAAYTATHGWPAHATRLSIILFRYLDAGHLIDALAIHSHARRAAHHIEDRRSEARSLDNLASVCWRQGDYRQATDYIQQALTLFRQIGDQCGEAQGLGHLSVVYGQQGHSGQAADHTRQAMALHRQLGDRYGEAYTVSNLGMAYMRQGDYRQAVEHYQQALNLHRLIGDRHGEAGTLDNLGSVYWRQGHYRQATDHLQQALTLFRQLGDHAGETETRNNLGETSHAAGRSEQARVWHASALTLATEIGDRYEQARAHSGLARAHHTTSDFDQARRHWRQALALYTDLGLQDADEIRAALSALDRGRPCGAGDGAENRR